MSKAKLFRVSIKLEGLYFAKDGKRPFGGDLLEVISEEYHNLCTDDDVEVSEMRKNSTIPDSYYGNTLVFGDHEGDLILDEALEKAGLE
jgi:hypothetical protein